MELKRTTEIFVETNRRFVIRQPEATEPIACPNCAEPLFAAEQIAAVFNISQRRLFQLVETGAAHYTETETGILLVCPNSLTEILADGREILGEKL